jgi:methionyl aminopeptidase
MMKSGSVLKKALILAENLIEPGITTKYIDDEVHKFIKKNQAIPVFLGYLGFPAACCISVNDEAVHGIPSDRVLEEGDIVSVDCGVVKNGAITDATRTFPVGKISAENKKLIRVTKASLDAGISKALVNNRVGHISNAIQSVVELSGFNVSREFTGHGIGYGLHMEPDVPNYGSKNRGDKLISGMYLAIEPVVFSGSWKIKYSGEWNVQSVDGGNVAHFENTVYITDMGPIVVTDDM